MKVVLDTDVMVAAIRSRKGKSRQWLKAALRKEVRIILSVPLVLQYEEVLTRPHHLKATGGTSAHVNTLLDALCAVSMPVEVSFLWRPMLRDPNDEMVLEAAIHGQADALLTFNERDYQGAERFGMRIIRPDPAWKQWKGE